MGIEAIKGLMGVRFDLPNPYPLEVKEFDHIGDIPDTFDART